LPKKYISKIDIRDTYSPIRVQGEDVWKTAICTCYGLFESLVMPFGLTNAPTIFQQDVNKILHPHLNVSCITYLDDVLIYSQTLEEYMQLVHQILDLLQQAGLQVKLQKYEFHNTTTECLGMLVTPEGLKMNSAKVSAMEQWPVPQ
jgi:hypothetical protein